MSRTITKIRWGKDICPLHKRVIDTMDCESCEHGYIGNYALKQTLCGYDSSEEKTTQDTSERRTQE